jgi:hypothetical protein
MDYEQAFPSKYLKASDLQDRPHSVVIAGIKFETIGDDRKLVMSFQGKQKGMVCNKTNAKRIAQLYGRNTEGWIGKEIVLFPTEVDFQGDTVPAIRVRMPKAAAGNSKHVDPEPPPPEPPPPLSEDLDDEIPF